jgi:hypothetical protein
MSSPGIVVAFRMKKEDVDCMQHIAARLYDMKVLPDKTVNAAAKRAAEKFITEFRQMEEKERQEAERELEEKTKRASASLARIKELEKV